MVNTDNIIPFSIPLQSRSSPGGQAVSGGK